MVRNDRRALATLVAVLGLAATSHAQNSTVITLVMPVGARQLGMGEASVGLADDVFANYWNPAGLAFGPLADEWEVTLSADRAGVPQLLATSERFGLLTRGQAWTATDRGLWWNDGRAWRDVGTAAIEEGLTLETVVRRWMGDLWPLDTARQAVILNQVGSASGATSPEEVSDLVEARLPWSIVLGDRSVTALAIDASNKLWVGTNDGLLRWDGVAWKHLGAEEGLGNSSVQALAVAGTSIWIGTPEGLWRLRQRGNEFQFRRFGESFGLASQDVVAVAASADGRTIWAASRAGGASRLAITREASTWKPFADTDGMLEGDVRGMVLQANGHLWAVHAGGVSHFDGSTWERLRFEGVEATSIALGHDGTVWVGSRQGAWSWLPQEAVQTASGGRAQGEAAGRWLHVHSGNGLHADDAQALASQGRDMWFATSAGVVRARRARNHVGFFYETLLPSLGLKDLFHTYAAATFPVKDWGTFGGSVKFISFGQNTFTDEMGEVIDEFSSYELVASLGYGTRMSRQWGFGLNFKFIYSSLAPGITIGDEKTDAVAASWAFDLGVLGRDIALPGLSFGAHLQNLGPAVFYIERDQSDPIPLTVRLGLGYRALDLPNHRLTLAADISREATSRTPAGRARNFLTGAWMGIAKPWGEVDTLHLDAGIGGIVQKNLEESVYNLGMEYLYLGTLALRSGLLFDPGGDRQEMHLGLGAAVSDVLQVDGTYIQPVNWIGNTRNTVREGQTRFSLNFMY